MKFRITFRDPGGYQDCIEREARRLLPKSSLPRLTDAEYEQAVEARELTLQDMAARWVEYDWHVTIEFDVEAGTARVIEIGGD